MKRASHVSHVSLVALVPVLSVLGCSATAPTTASSNVAEGAAETTATLTTLRASVRRDAGLSARFAPTRAGFTRTGDAFVSATRERESEATSPALRAGVSAFANGAWEISLARDADVHLSLTPLDHLASQGAIDGGRVVYRDAAPSTDAVFASGDTWSELAWILRDARAPSNFHFRVTSAPGTQLASEGADGLAFVDANGRARLHMTAPFAIDARGVRRAASLGVDHDVLTIAIDTRGLEYPIVLDPYIATASWVRQLVDPPRRTSTSLGALGSNLVLFGGQGAAAPLGDTWTYDGSRWSPDVPTTAPSARTGAISATVGGKLIVFGGSDGKTQLKDTWSFDGSAWIQVMTAHSPMCSSGAEVTTLAGKMICVGDDFAGHMQMWTFDGSDWTADSAMMPLETGFLGVSGTDAVFVDPSKGNTLTWNASTGWKTVAMGASGPVYGAGAIGVVAGELTFVDGNLSAWTWTGTSWKQTVMGDAQTTYSIDGYTVADKMYFLAEPFLGGRQLLWSFDGSDFATVDTADAPHVILDQDAFATYGTRAGYLGDPGWMWEWDGKRWSRTKLASNLGIVMGMTGNGTSLLALTFGGSATSWDTYSWDGKTWSLLSPAHPLANGNRPWMATLGTTPVAVMLGSMPGTTAFATWTGSDWQLMGNAAAFPIAFGTFAADGVLIGLAQSDQATPQEWHLSPTAGWTQSTSRTLPNVGAQDTGEIATIGTRGLLHLAGPVSPAREYVTTDGAWSQVAIGGLPPLQKAHLATYGSTVLAFGGADDDGVAQSDLYSLAVTLENGVACSAGGDCSSGACSQGVCCNHTCDGTTSRCDLAATKGTCTPLTAACTGPTTLQSADGTTKECTPYLCSAAMCLQKCATSSDCSGGFTCDTSSSQCLAPSTSPPSSGCAVSTSSDDASGSHATLAIAGLVVACTAIARRRRVK